MKLILSLDLPTKEENLSLVRKLKDYDIWLKVGFRSFIRDTKEFLYELKEINNKFNIFLDLKLYDIPNTMADAAKEIANLPVDMFNIHASSGEVAMRTVVKELSILNKKPLILAVTALTSFDDKNFKQIYHNPIEQSAIDLARLSFKNSLDGVVCSVLESKKIKEATNKNFITLTPGIRFNSSKKDDQQRVATPLQAKENLVDFIVVGRPIYQNPDPKRIVESILEIL
jgi:orotidine-5'-phosphate decarboxylase